MDILSPVEKLIYYRKMYKISQEELVRDSIARSYLAMIESKRKKLNNKIAGILVDNFNTILEEKEINFSLSLDYLLEEKETQITQITETMLTKLNNDKVDSIAFEAEKLFLEEESKDNKKRIYMEIGNTYFEKNDYSNSNKFYQEILGIIIKDKEKDLLEEVVLKMLRGNLEIEAYANNLLLSKKIEKFVESFTKSGKREYLYSVAVSSLKTKNCTRPLEVFKELEKSSTLDEIFELKMLQAECCTKSKDYDEAASIYRGALLKFKDKSKKLVVNYNLLKLARSLDDAEKIALYLRKIFILLDELDLSEIDSSDNILYQVGITSKELGKRKKALTCFQELLANSDNIDLKFEAINNSLDMLRKQELRQVKILEESFFNLLEQKENYKIGYKFILFYSSNSLEKCEERFKTKIEKFI